MKKAQQTGLQQGKLCVVPYDVLGENAVNDFDVLRCGQLVCVLEVSDIEALFTQAIGSFPIGAHPVNVKVLSSEGVVASVQVALTELVSWKEVDQ
jgi:hypothetical protein